MKTASHMRRLVLSGIAGVLVSTYALYVEMAVEARPGYEALCDFSPKASCSRVLSSEFAKGFGLLGKDSPLRIPNCIYGIIYFCLIIFMSTFDNFQLIRVQFLLSLAAVGSCVYLAYLLIFVLQDFCVVCVTSYLINVLIAILTFNKMKALSYAKIAKNK